MLFFHFYILMVKGCQYFCLHERRSFALISLWKTLKFIYDFIFTTVHHCTSNFYFLEKWFLRQCAAQSWFGCVFLSFRFNKHLITRPSHPPLIKSYSEEWVFSVLCFASTGVSNKEWLPLLLSYILLIYHKTRRLFCKTVWLLDL